MCVFVLVNVLTTTIENLDQSEQACGNIFAKFHPDGIDTLRVTGHTKILEGWKDRLTRANLYATNPHNVGS